MNWITRKSFNKETDMEDRVCEHLAANPDLPGTTFIENDSFGYVGTSAKCKACAEEVIEQERQGTVCCNDCSKMFPRGDVIRWTPYDYYPAQGDEAIFVCIDCSRAEKHQFRIEQDERFRQEEYGFAGDDDSEVYDLDE